MAFSDPQKNIEVLGLEAGAYVADLGAGSGFYTLAAAKAVGSGGRVYAVDVQQDLLSRIKNAAHTEHLTNIEVVHGDIEQEGGSRLKDMSEDVVLACNVFFQIEHKEGFLKEVSRILKTNGRLLLVDWSDSFGGMGPHPDQVIEQSEAKSILEKNGFIFINGISAGDHHYGLIVRKK